jgi:hypothetical protein
MVHLGVPLEIQRYAMMEAVVLGISAAPMVQHAHQQTLSMLAARLK